MKLAIVVGIALGTVCTCFALAEDITSDTATTAPSDAPGMDSPSLQVTSASATETAPASSAVTLPALGVLISGSIATSPPKDSSEAGPSPVAPNTVPTPGTVTLMAMSAVTIFGRSRRAPAGG